MADLDVLIVDCQATGAGPSTGCVLELGWGVIRASAAELVAAEASWIKLPSGHVVSKQVRRLTGYDPQAVGDEIDDREAWARLRDAVNRQSGAPLAIHFARFELGFLRDWATRFEPDTPFPFDAVCVYSIANRLYPTLPRQSLRALAGYLGFSLHLARRSRGHVEATAFVWRRLCSELAAHGVATWEELQTWLAAPAPKKVRGKRPKYPIEPARYRSLPDEPGVYRFLRSNGDVLYVGKASSLKKRTASHFTARAGASQAPEMLTQVSEIAVTVTATALEAALIENETIKSLRPPYNVQLAESELPLWYGTREFMETAPTFDERHRLGPLSSPYALRPLAALGALLVGAEQTTRLRADAVGISALWPPSPEVFARGWAELFARHPCDLWTAPTSPRQNALRLARRFLLAPVFARAQDDAEPDREEADQHWDPERVARHLERAISGAYRAYRRARWMWLVRDSDIVYREPGREQARLLRVRGGAIVDARDAAVDHAPESPIVRSSACTRPAPESRPAFDRASYDRLRVLTTELKRVVRDGGEVSVLWGPRRRLPKRWLAGTLSVI